MLQVRIDHNFDQVAKALEVDRKQARFAASVALNRAMQAGEREVQLAMRRVFHKPTTFFLRSLRVIRSTTRGENIEAGLWFKDGNRDTGGDAMVVPHIEGGPRRPKPFELRLQRANLMPRGWFAVPGAGADLDANGNMSRGQLSQLLNVLGTYTEAGYNKANAKTKARLRAGNAKRGTYGFEYFVVPVRSKRAAHLHPGIWKRVYTGFGQALRPVLMFVSKATYQKRLDFYGITTKTVDARFPEEFDKAWDMAMRTAR